MNASGGRPPSRKTVHGVGIGILMLDTGFERLLGDIGNGATWDFPVQYKVVRGATGDRVTAAGGGGTLDLFLAAADELVNAGVEGIATSCGFLALFQEEMTARCRVPVATSALLQVSLVQTLLPRGKTVGILTANKAALTAAHFQAVKCPTDLPVVGMPPDGIFRANLTRNEPSVSFEDQQCEVFQMADQLMAEEPNVGAIVCECTNLAPYSASIAKRWGVPVFDVVTMVNWLHAAIRPRHFAHPN